MIESNSKKLTNATKAKEVKPRNKEFNFTFGMIKVIFTQGGKK